MRVDLCDFSGRDRIANPGDKAFCGRVFSDDLDGSDDDSLPAGGLYQTQLDGFLHYSLRVLPFGPFSTAGQWLIMELCLSLSNAIFMRIGGARKTGFRLA